MKRTQTLPPVRLSKAEKAAIEENAERAGLSVSAYVRRQTCGDLRPSVEPNQRSESDFEARVRENSKTMPRRNAEVAARREEARERAKAALLGTR